MEYSNKEKIEWTIIFVYEFGKKHGLNMKQSIGYLSRFKGTDFIDRHLWLRPHPVFQNNDRRNRRAVPQERRAAAMILCHGANAYFGKIDLGKSIQHLTRL